MTAEALAVLDAAIDEHQPAHVFAMFSGGHDSLAAAAVTARHPRFTACVHINTGIGIEETRRFVRDTCRERGWPLLEYGPPKRSYESMVLDWGFPGPQQHKVMYSRLKREAVRELVRSHLPGRVLLSTGIRLGESIRRMQNYSGDDGHRYDPDTRAAWANPIARWSKADCLDLIDRDALRRNRVVDLLHKSGECLCGAFAAPGEIRELELWFPDVAAYLHDLERRAERAGRIGCVWGRRLDDVHRDQLRLMPILPLCTSCEAAA